MGPFNKLTVRSCMSLRRLGSLYLVRGIQDGLSKTARKIPGLRTIDPLFFANCVAQVETMYVPVCAISCVHSTTFPVWVPACSLDRAE